MGDGAEAEALFDVLDDGTGEISQSQFLAAVSAAEDNETSVFTSFAEAPVEQCAVEEMAGDRWRRASLSTTLPEGASPIGELQSHLSGSSCGTDESSGIECADLPRSNYTVKELDLSEPTALVY